MPKSSLQFATCVTLRCSIAAAQCSNACRGPRASSNRESGLRPPRPGSVTARNPNDAVAFASLGLDLAREQKYDEAAPAYRKALKLDPRLPGLQLNLGLAEFKQGHFSAAATALRAAVAADPSSLQARTVLGMSYYGARKFDLASKYLEPAQRLIPRTPNSTRCWPRAVSGQRSWIAPATSFARCCSRARTRLRRTCLWARRSTGWARLPRRSRNSRPPLKFLHKSRTCILASAISIGNRNNTIEAREGVRARAGGRSQSRPGSGLSRGHRMEERPSGCCASLAAAGDSAEERSAHRLRRSGGDLPAAKEITKKRRLRSPRQSLLDPDQPDAHYQLGRLYQAQGNSAAAAAELSKVRELHAKADQGLAGKMPITTAPDSTVSK